jgi:hypothetical protein
MSEVGEHNEQAQAGPRSSLYLVQSSCGVDGLAMPEIRSLASPVCGGRSKERSKGASVDLVTKGREYRRDMYWGERGRKPHE